MAIARIHDASSPQPGEPRTGARAVANALQREFESMAKLHAMDQPAEIREAMLVGHRQRILLLLQEPGGEVRLDAKNGNHAAPEQPEVPLELEDALGFEEALEFEEPLGLEEAPELEEEAPEAAAAIPEPRPQPEEPRRQRSVREIHARRARWRLDPARLRRTVQVSIVIGGAFLVGVTAYSQRALFLGLGRAAAAAGRDGAEWLEHEVEALKRPAPQRGGGSGAEWLRAERLKRSPPPPVAAGPPPPKPSVRPARQQGRVATATRGAGGGAAPRQPAGMARPADTPAGVRSVPADGAPRARDVSQAPRHVGGALAATPAVPAGSHRSILATIYDPSGNPVGWRLWVSGPREQMFAAFDELAAWSSARFGAGHRLVQATEPGEWKADTRWTTPPAVVELRGRIDPLGGARVWAVDLQGGAIRAVEDAEVELTYRSGGDR